MRVIVIGYPLPNPAIDNYNPFTAPSYSDYDALFIDPASITKVAARLLNDGESFEAFDGRLVVNAGTTASTISAADLLKRRLDETVRLLELGGTVVVMGRPNAPQAGIVGFEGCDRYSWLPAPSGVSWGPPHLRAADGRSVRITSEDHAFVTVLREHRKDISYRAAFDDRNAQVRAAGKTFAVGGSDVPIGMDFKVLGGRVIFLPVFSDDPFGRSELAQRVVDAVRQVSDRGVEADTPYWAANLPVPGIETVEADLKEAESAASDATARVTAAREQRDTLAAHRRLLTEEGRALSEAARKALELLGFTVLPGETSNTGFAVESDGTTAFVEVEGSREEVVEWPYVRLQRRLEQRLLKEGDSPRGIVVANGRRTLAPDGRYEGQVTAALRNACENYRYCLVTGETLFAMVQKVLGGEDEGALPGMRRRLLATAGVLDKDAALGEGGEAGERGPIF